MLKSVRKESQSGDQPHITIDKKMNITLDIKTLLTIGGFVAILGGFYYSTQHRLTSLETTIAHISQQQDAQSGELRVIKKQLRKKK